MHTTSTINKRILKEWKDLCTRTVWKRE